MDASQIIENQIAELLSANDIYSTYKDRWTELFQAYIGGEDYTMAGYLHKYQLETAGEYATRLETTPLENHCKSVVSVYNSFLFREKPYRDLSGLDNSPILEEFLKDCDQDGHSLNEIMREVSTWSSVFGHVWMIITKPNLGLATQGEELDMGVRPYVNVLTPLAVTDWNWYRTPIGKYKLDYLKYVEDFNGSIQVLKEWTPETISTYTINTEDNIILEEIVEENQLGYIPAVIAYNQRSSVRGIGVSDIQDIALMQKYIYNCTSEAAEAIKMDTHPSVVATPNTQLGTGPGSVIKIEESLDPGLKPYVLEFSGASVDTIYKAIQHSIEAIDKMANTGAVRATEARTMSGVALETEMSLLNARIAQKASALEMAEENLFKIVADYMGMKWTGYIEYPNSFNIRDKDREIQQLRVAKEVATDPRVIAEIDKKLIDWMDLEEEEADMLLNTPAPRTYENGEPIDARLPEAYRNATGEEKQCENCAFYNAQTFQCSAFGNAPVRPMWVCARWEATDAGSQG